MKRKTIKNTVEISGIGLHKGEEIKLALKSNGQESDEQGIIFKRVDVAGKNNIVKVDYRNLFDLERGTNIRNEDDVKVHTIEHFLSALSVTGITDILVEISGNELPILDGSSAGFVEKLLEAEIVELESEIEPVVIKEPVIFSDEKAGKYVMALPYDNEIEFLKKNNLALGGSLENAVVVGADGPLNPEGLRYPDEFVRHKILDIVGDLYVLGRPLQAHIIAIKAGHYVNSRLTEMIAKKYF